MEGAIQSTVGMRFEWGAFRGRSELEVPTGDLLFHFCHFMFRRGQPGQESRGFPRMLEDLASPVRIHRC